MRGSQSLIIIIIAAAAPIVHHSTKELEVVYLVPPYYFILTTIGPKAETERLVQSDPVSPHAGDRNLGLPILSTTF